MGSLKSGTDWALSLIRTLPRVTIGNLRPNDHFEYRRTRGQHGGKRHGAPQKGAKQRQNYPRLGFEGGNTPFYLRIPREFYYKNHHVRRQYPPLSLRNLQLLIDTNRIDPSKPIDLTAICNTKIFWINPAEKHHGFHLTEDGLDSFNTKVNLEVQWATERVIAAVERCGGTITTTYLDIESLRAAVDPVTFFQTGKPIPKKMLPPEDAIEYYTDPKMRGYLADPEEVAKDRFVLSQKYGYQLNNLSTDPDKELLLARKDPKQIFYGLHPGWVVSMRDKCILKPKDPRLIEYYNN